MWCNSTSAGEVLVWRRRWRWRVQNIRGRVKDESLKKAIA
jgi:hypothetical protein